MKKTILLFGAAFMIISMSCQRKCDYSPEAKALGDTTSIMLGKNYGFELRRQNDRYFKAAKLQDRFSPEEYIRGVEYIMSTDTANFSYLKGLHDAMDLYMNMMQVSQRYQIPVDINLIVKTLKETYYCDTINDFHLMMQLTELNNRFKDYEAKLKGKPLPPKPQPQPRPNNVDGKQQLNTESEAAATDTKGTAPEVNQAADNQPEVPVTEAKEKK